METIDYKALARERGTGKRRPIVRHVICLDPELYADLEEAQQDLKDLIADEQDETAPAADVRGGGLPPRSQAQHRVDEIEKQIAAVSVVGIFRALPSDKQGEMTDLLVKEQEDNPNQAEAAALKHSREIILLSFDHFEGPEKKRIDLDKEDLEVMLPDWSQGEVMTLANKINRAAMIGHDAPKSVRLSLSNQPSAAT